MNERTNGRTDNANPGVAENIRLFRRRVNQDIQDIQENNLSLSIHSKVAIYIYYVY